MCFYLARKSHSGYSDWTSAIKKKKKKAVLRDGSILQTAVQRKILTDVKMKAEKSLKDKDIIFSLFLLSHIYTDVPSVLAVAATLHTLI